MRAKPIGSSGPSRTFNAGVPLHGRSVDASPGLGCRGAACVVSLVDRLVHNAEVVAIDGESYRLKEATERAEHRARKRRGQPS